MRDQFRGYDRWKLSNREDEEDAANARHRRELEREERADEERDRAKDEEREEEFSDDPRENGWVGSDGLP